MPRGIDIEPDDGHAASPRSKRCFLPDAYCPAFLPEKACAKIKGVPVFYLVTLELSAGTPEVIALQTTIGPIVVLFRSRDRADAFVGALGAALQTHSELLIGEIDAASLPGAVAQLIKGRLIKPGAVNVVTDDDPVVRTMLPTS